MKRGKLFWLGILSVMFLLMAAVVFSQVSAPSGAYAGASIVGDSTNSNVRALVAVNGDDKVTRVVYFKMENHGTGGANTPVSSGNYCGNAFSGMLHEATVKLSGTMTGTAPTVAIKWQNSKDGGTVWTDVGTWTTINATVTPASQTNTVADNGPVVLMNANTPVTTPPVVYGDCWRALYTMTGTGAAANFSVTGIDK